MYLPVFHFHTDQNLIDYLQLNCKIRTEQNNSQIRIICFATVQSDYLTVFQILPILCVPMVVTRAPAKTYCKKNESCNVVLHVSVRLKC